MNLSTILGETMPQLVTGLQGLVARINTVWGKEHQADGTHAIPKHISATTADLGAGNFRATGGTWTVAFADITSFEWWKHGDALQVGFYIGGTVGSTPTPLSFDIPGGYRAKKAFGNPIFIVDNGTRTTGYAYVAPNGTTVDIYRTDGAAFTAGAVIVNGQLQFRTTA